MYRSANAVKNVDITEIMCYNTTGIDLNKQST